MIEEATPTTETAAETDTETGTEPEKALADLASPAAEYAARRERFRAEEQRWRRLAGRLSFARLGVFLAAGLAAWLGFVSNALHPLWLLPLVAGFLALVLFHDRILRRRSAASRRADLYDAGLARLEDRWAGRGFGGEEYLDEEHPYAGDLDLFGPGSLFELLCTARTRVGQGTLARWLCQPGEPKTVRERQEAVGELRPRLDLREDLALIGEDVQSGLHPEALEAWVAAPPWRVSPWLRLTAIAASLASLATLGGWLLGSLPSWVFGLALLCHGLLWLWLRAGFEEVVEAAEQPGRDLELLSGLLEKIEEEEVSCELLSRLRRGLETAGLPPSRQIARLGRLIDLLDARRNQMFAAVDLLTFWSFHLAIALESWRRRCGPALSGWLAAAGRFEALSSLAGYAYEHPGDPFPELVEKGPVFEGPVFEGPVFEGKGITHPLLPASAAVRNDLHLEAAPQAMIVSGSNMSGKSTLLRAVGTNVVLAQAGAPVRALSLRLSPLAPGASIRVQDSLRQGKSRFYAEITRLQQIVELCEGPRPVLFLVDELLAGTNSHDRRIGAEALVKGLVAKGALGLLTTHDLALARVVDSLAPKVANVHFEDTLEDGELSFDYQLREGVVEKSNALELMRSVGLRV